MAQYKFSDVLNILKSSASEFSNNNSFRHAAALSYYTIFSLPPLLLIVITTASAIYGGEALTGQIYGQLKGLVGADSAAFLQESIAKFTLQQKSGLATVIGVGTLIFAATTFFVTLQESINDIWNLKVKTEGIGIGQYLQQRLLSFGLILSVALLLLISFVVSAVLSIFTGWLQRHIPEAGVIAIKLVDFSLSLIVTTLLFALIYRFLPDAIIRWRDVGIGAFITAVLFIAGKYLISFYIAKADPGSAFGAAGSAGAGLHAARATAAPSRTVARDLTAAGRPGRRSPWPAGRGGARAPRRGCRTASPARCARPPPPRRRRPRHRPDRAPSTTAPA